MAYLLDANVFIQAKNLHYGLDFCPAFWDWLIDRNAAGAVFSIEKVGDEIEAGQDDLSAWAAERSAGFFLKPDAPMLGALATTPGGPCACPRPHGRHARATIAVDQEDQDPERLHRSGRQVHDPLRDAARRARTVRARCRELLGDS